MRVFNSTGEASGKIKNAVVTTGSFDGVHIGHKVIINRLNQIAKDIAGESVLITFYPHPRKVLYPEQKDLRLINSQEEKIELLQKAGLDNLIIIPFSIEFSKTSSHDFITNILVGELHAKVIVVGHNHHFGHNRMGDYSYLDTLSKQYGFKVEEIPLLDIENETVSSTKIRRALFEGNIQRANAYLDHQYIIHGHISAEHSNKIQVNTKVVAIIISEEEKLIPPPGIYATNLRVKDQWYKTMTMISIPEGEKMLVTTQLLYDSLPTEKDSGTLYFYKKVSDADILDTSVDQAKVLQEAKEMVEDLIY
jgi:riboflavin kinase / FMN adenylyltransferase